MKRKNILKFISLLGVGSFVLLAAASCKQPIAEKPTKPTKPTDPSNGGSTMNPPSSGGMDNSSSSSGSNSGSGSNMDSNANSGGGMDITPNYEADKAKLQDFASKLTEQDFEIFNNNAKAEKNSINVNSLSNDSFKLVETKKNTIPVMGWNLGVELVSNSKNTTQGSVKIKIKFIKEGISDISTTPVELTITGFKSLQSSVASILFKEQMVAPTQGSAMKENKKVLDLGDAMFETLVDLNDTAMSDNPTSETTSSSSAGSVESRSSTVMLRDGETPSPAATDKPSVTKKDNLNDKFSHSIKEQIKTDLDALSSEYSGFNSSDLYLIGSAKLVSLYKKENSDWQGTYYLTSKDENDNKLVIKSKSITDFSLDVPGIVIKNLLPDSVKVFVSKIGEEKLDINQESNLDSYKKQIQSENTANNTNNKNGKYKIENGILYVQPDDFIRGTKLPLLELNPIKVKHVESSKSDKIFFKSQYVFDGTGIFDGEIFATNLKFKKALNWDSGYNSEALKSEYLSSIWYGVNYIPGSNSQNIDVSTLKNKPGVQDDFKGGSNENEFYSKELNDQNSIKGNLNTSGDGVALLVNPSTMNNYITHGSNNDNKGSVNENEGTNFLIFPRLKYKKNDNTDAYLWSSTVTIVYFAPKTMTPAAA
ncbi:hypothetical protein LNO75_00960 [Mycoplasma sp. T363T]|uniref:hypothetical protein n=1 Tax=Mycoplasma bradburyae TaxID=2963128 RepID=UPI0023420A7F|nr:hypothetical protein [Mycoplasma bradburyae]MDC4163147.1 hypothetical protein [Mycoplasma bradburyae]